jgi:hypothetical protein
VQELRERLSERDMQILDHVARLRLLCARQVEALLFPPENHASPATAARCCRRVLERLARERLLIRLERRVGGVRAGSASYIYALAPLGHRVVDDGRPRKRLREPSSLFVEHTLAVADFLVELVVAARRGEWQLDAWQSEPVSWQEVTTIGGRLVLRPDLFVVLAAGEYELRWFVEIDRGTEHLPALRRKCRVYHSYYKNGTEQRKHGVSPRVLWVVPSDRRADLLRAAIDADRILTSALFRVATREQALEAIGERQ